MALQFDLPDVEPREMPATDAELLLARRAA